MNKNKEMPRLVFRQRMSKHTYRALAGRQIVEDNDTTEFDEDGYRHFYSNGKSVWVRN